MKVRLSRRSQITLLAIWDWNEERHGAARADRYVALLYREIERLAEDSLPGRAIGVKPTLRYLDLRRRARTQGHIVAFEVLPDEIKVIDVFHTAQDWRTKLEDL